MRTSLFTVGLDARLAFAWVILAAAACSDTARPTAAPPYTPSSIPTDTVRTIDLAPGIRHTYRWEVSGPWAIHIVEVDLARCGVALRTVKALDRLIGRETTTQLSARLANRLGRPVIAAVNGDYFSFTPPGYPVGSQVSEGEPLRGYTSRPVFGVTAAGAPFFGADQLTGVVRSSRGATFAMRRVNEPPDTMNITLYNGYVGAATPDDAGTVEVVLRVVRRGGGVGDTVRAVVQGLDTLAAGVAIPAGGAVLAARGRGATFLRVNMTAGDTVSWVMRFPGAPGSIAELIAGDPHLLRGGVTQAPFAGSVAAERNPRTAIAVTADRKTLLVTVDGRLPNYSVGMTLVELSALLARIGATEALNVDGGGSTTMVVNGRYVNHPSDAEGERPVSNAVAVVGPAPGSCSSP